MGRGPSTRSARTEPVEGPSSYEEFLNERGEGLHHLGYFVADIDEVAERWKTRASPSSRAAGASAGHDADDRIIYNTSNGNLYYDADGSGGGRAMFVGVLHGAPGLDASDIAII